MSLKSQLESLLFVAIKPLSIRELSNLTKTDQAQVESALKDLGEDYQSSARGLKLIENNQQYQLTTAPANAEIVKNFLQDETSGELSQPSLEALTIISYRGPITKLELEEIRGVNCSLIIRNLLLRGLIEEKPGSGGEASVYTVSHEFVRFLGINNLSELPDYQKLRNLEIEQEVSPTQTEESVDANN